MRSVTKAKIFPKGVQKRVEDEEKCGDGLHALTCACTSTTNPASNTPMLTLLRRRTVQQKFRNGRRIGRQTLFIVRILKVIDDGFGTGLFVRTDSSRMERQRRYPHALQSTSDAKLLPMSTSHFSHMLDVTQARPLL